MKGEPIESVKVGIEAMLSTLRSEPYALDTVNLSVITFDRDVKILVPLTPLEDFQLPDIIVPDSGPTHTGAALETLCKQVKKEVRLSTPEQKGDWMPLLFLLTDGKPSDIQVYNNVIPMVQQCHFAGIVACAAGMHAKTEPLKQLTDKVYALDTLDSASFKKFFQWVSASIEIGNKSIGATDELELPPPPEEVNVIV